MGRDVSPVLYYTGHCDSDGDWRFRNGGWISFRHLIEMKEEVYADKIATLHVWSDCCYAGKWAFEAAAMKFPPFLLAASNASKCARNRVFARAVFRGSSADQDRLWSCDIDAVGCQGAEVKYFKGSGG